MGELEGGASVTDLLVTNTATDPLLVYEGQEVLGAQQNRTFDCSILIGPGMKVRAPVTCVERGRWDGSRATEEFVESPQTADPSLRHTKRYAANAASAAGLEARADQGEVREQDDARIERFAAPSPSDSMHEVYETRRGRLNELSDAVQHVPGQLGAVAAVSGLPVVCDLVSRPDVFATLLPRLAQGYALEALDRPEGPDRRPTGPGGCWPRSSRPTSARWPRRVWGRPSPSTAGSPGAGSTTGTS